MVELGAVVGRSPPHTRMLEGPYSWLLEGSYFWVLEGPYSGMLEGPYTWVLGVLSGVGGVTVGMAGSCLPAISGQAAVAPS